MQKNRRSAVRKIRGVAYALTLLEPLRAILSQADLPRLNADFSLTPRHQFIGNPLLRIKIGILAVQILKLVINPADIYAV